ncbi:hypothetical protein HX017_01780 [Myroides marinus]|uniref:hypothetical protein n=1 Tax=Myroides marinus TaxID=703342 RepID=UPI0007422672|nr:hypothetical protein [Myroides marinus]KUF39411.1 hypothetical protein AS361_02190 [Myroides marinus]MDM1345852.1 hypothetical protein [Myroides marinus]MDM1349287.1 hypothetical protein [Myroides marinus]MDM1353035.1 hypothetical protein [Myroides marinus]MDM1356497.1 hypothetical protein [Myroides marinus]
MRNTFLLVILLCVQQLIAQQSNQPFYFDLSYERVEKGSRAEYYATHTPIENSILSDITLYRIDTNAPSIKGQAIWDGKKIDFKSNVYTYLSDGKLLSVKHYDSNKKAFTHEVSYNPATRDSLVMLHTPSSRYEGEIYDSYNGKLFYTRHQQGIPRTEIVYNLNNQKNRLEVNYNKDYETIDEVYYDEAGTKKYTLMYQNNEPYSGTSVILSYKNFGIGIFSEFVNDEEIKQTTYYSSSKIKQKRTSKNSVVKTETYSQNGKRLAVFTEKKTEGDNTINKTGTKYVFDHLFVDFDRVLEEQYYNGDLLQKKIDYKYEKDTKYASIVTKYKDGLPVLTEYFDTHNNKIDQATYLDNDTKIKDGLQVDSSTYDVYKKEGETIKEIHKYGTQEVFSIETPTHTTFYSQKGEELGKVTNYESYWGQRLYDTGDVYELIYDIPLLTSKYQDKKMVYKVEYSFDTVDPKLAIEQFFTEEVMTEQKTYHKNGQLNEHTIIDPKSSSSLEQTGRQLDQSNNTKKSNL